MVWKKLVACIMQWKANYSASVEITAYIEAGRVMNELKRMDTKLTARIDALEQSQDDVLEKYLRKITAREIRGKQKDSAEAQVIEIDPYKELRERRT